MNAKKILVIGAAGRVGMQIAFELLRHNHNVVMVDVLPQKLLEQRAGRLLNDCRIAQGYCRGSVQVYGDIDALITEPLVEILKIEQPNLVINYAIPITWDATKRLPNYSTVSAAGLGAFTPIQVITPLRISQAITASGIQTRYMVGNLPDITIPVVNAIAREQGLQHALCGAGNVGLNQIAMRYQAALELGADFDQVDVSLVSHHMHWVAPREPGYSNEAPYLAKVTLAGEDVSTQFDDLRALMNRGVQAHYESDASFSSTTGILASRVALALIDESDHIHQLHTPAPNGLPGGYPVQIRNGIISLNLPEEWNIDDAISAMKNCHTLDGVQTIEEDGTVQFTEIAQSILRDELGFELPARMTPDDIEVTARSQITILNRHFAANQSG